MAAKRVRNRYKNQRGASTPEGASVDYEPFNEKMRTAASGRLAETAYKKTLTERERIPTMPVPDEEAIARQRRRSSQRRRGRGGRNQSILSSDETLG